MPEQSRTRAPHRRLFESAPRVVRGDLVRRIRDDEKNPGWFFGVAADGVEGYFPRSWFEVEAGGVSARALRDYDGMELTVEGDVIVERLAEESGSVLVRTEQGQEGWIPTTCVS